MKPVESGTTQNRDRDDLADAPETSYRCLFELNPEPALLLDLQGHVVTSNQMARDLLGSWSDASHSLTIEHGLPGLGAQSDTAAGEVMAQLFCDVQDQGIARWEFELPGSDRVMEARLSCVPEACVPEGGFLWTAHDVTERVHLERTRQELVNMLVHDLRAPLGNIQNSLDLVLTAWRERDTTLPMEQVLHIGLRSAQRMDRLINDILDSARLQAHERTLTVTSIDIKTLVDEAVEIIATQAQRREQMLEVQVDPGLPPMQGDLDLLRRVLVNLLGNAVKFTQDGGEITVKVELVDEAAASGADISASHSSATDMSMVDTAVADTAQFRFTVADNGPGISPQVQEHLFELFFRGGTTKAKGAGIGLAFCKLAVKAHGGHIWVDSAIGAGSVFTFTIPRVLPKHTPYYQEDES